MNETLKGLSEVVKQRKEHFEEGSYTCYLFDKGLDKILKKCGEECSEMIIAAKNNDNEELANEISDLVYHVLVLMVDMGITVDDIKNELQSRHVIDHKVKQETLQ